MAIRVYICRADTPSDVSDDPITLQEWKHVVNDIPEMRLFEGQEALPPHVEAPSASEGLARWAGHPRFEAVWLRYDDGLVYTDSYDAYIGMRMRVLANRLDASVMDEHGALL